jgi:hypothetical protein
MAASPALKAITAFPPPVSPAVSHRLRLACSQPQQPFQVHPEDGLLFVLGQVLEA